MGTAIGGGIPVGFGGKQKLAFSATICSTSRNGREAVEIGGNYRDRKRFKTDYAEPINRYQSLRREFESRDPMNKKQHTPPHLVGFTPLPFGRRV